MEESNLEASVRARLIVAGLEELHEHGISDFSLRRVAISAQVSCAAPYRHFKDKNELIGAIIDYIASRWELLCKEIYTAYADDPERLVIELCVADLRFWIANGSFRTVLMTGDVRFADRLEAFDAPIGRAISSYLEQTTSQARPHKSAQECIYAIRTLIYGTVLLITQGRVAPSADTVALVRAEVERLIS